MLYTIVQCRVPSEKFDGLRPAAGNFEMDFRDGEVQQKASLDIADGGELTTKSVDDLGSGPACSRRTGICQAS